jgi:transcriptional regulator with XRE-family HTH domain
MQIYEKIKYMRQHKGFSQEKMAEKLGMSVNNYSSIERGKTDLHVSRLEEIASILQVNLFELLSFGEKSVYYLSGTNNGGIMGQYNLANDAQYKSQLEKSQLIIEQKEKEIEYLKQQNIDLREMIALLKNGKQV